MVSHIKATSLQTDRQTSTLAGHCHQPVLLLDLGHCTRVHLSSNIIRISKTRCGAGYLDWDLLALADVDDPCSYGLVLFESEVVLRLVCSDC